MSQSKDGGGVDLPLAALAKGAEEVRAESARLNKRIQALQDWFSKLDGVVSAEAKVPHTEDHPAATVILDMPSRKLYVIAERGKKLVEATSASLELKIAVIEAAPMLLERQTSHQRELIDRLAGANARFDEFAEQIGLTVEEGE